MSKNLHSIDCRWTEALAFTAEVDGHKIPLDADPEFGGRDKGPRPKKLLLVGLAGCTGMDVVSILEKMRHKPKYFNIKVNGEVTETEPKHYQQIEIIYQCSKEVPLENLQKAIELSQEKYCGVSAQLRPSCEIKYRIEQI